MSLFAILTILKFHTLNIILSIEIEYVKKNIHIFQDRSNTHIISNIKAGRYSTNRVIFQLISQPDTGLTHKLLRVAVDSVYD